MSKIPNTVKDKFVDIQIIDDEWEIKTDTGWSDIPFIGKTVPYDVWTIKLENGMFLDCADDHIIFDRNMNEIFVSDVKIGQEIHTEQGLSKALYISKKNHQENMYDIQVNDENHRYYTNGILSHNTIIVIGFMLWFSLFHSDKTIHILSNKGKFRSGKYSRF